MKLVSKYQTKNKSKQKAAQPQKDVGTKMQPRLNR